MKNSNILSLVFVVGIFIVIACSCPKEIQDEIDKETKKNSSNTSSVSNTSTSSTKDDSKADSKTDSKGNDARLTLENYNKIKNGMSIKEVREIMGSDGVETMSSGTGKYKVNTIQWKGDNFKFLSVVFIGEKVSSKVQNGLE